MKRIQSYIYALLILGLAIAGCTKIEDYVSSDVLTKPTVTLAVSAVADSSFTVDMATDKAGIIGYLVTSDTSLNAAAINVVALSLKKESTTKANSTFDLDAAGNKTEMVGGLMPNTYYKVFVAATNTDGVESTVESYMVKTDDGVGPTFKSSSPAIGGDPEVEIGADIVLTFDEPVKVNNSKKITISYFYEEVDIVVSADDVSAAGNSVTIKQSHTGHARDYFFISWEEGAVTDLSDNACAARVSGVIDNTLKGNYYRMVAENFTVADQTVAPEAGEVLANHDFSIDITFPFTVKLTDDYVKSMVKFQYTNWLETEVRVVDIAEDCEIVNDNTLRIFQPIYCNHGDEIALMVDEGVIKDKYGNINDATEYELTWNLGDFVVADDITPENGSVLTSQEFMVEIKFDFPIMTVEDGTEGMISMTYMEEDGSKSTVQADAYGISSANDSVLVILTPQPANFGSKVYLNIEENVVMDADGNVNLELQEVVYWDVPKLAATPDVMFGTYEAICTSNWDTDGTLVYEMTLTVSEYAASPEDTVLVSGLEGSASEVKVAFKDGFLSMPAMQSLGDLMGDGSTVYTYCGYYEDKKGAGTVLESGKVTMDWGSVIVGGDFDGYYYDLYPGSVWTKQPATASQVKGDRSYAKKRPHKLSDL